MSLLSAFVEKKTTSVDSHLLLNQIPNFEMDPAEAENETEFLPHDVDTLDVMSDANKGPQVIDADPNLESLIEGDPSVVVGTHSEEDANEELADPKNPILLLDQDQISQLENVLQSAEARGMLGDVIGQDDQVEGDDDNLLEFISEEGQEVKEESQEDTLTQELESDANIEKVNSLFI